MKVCKRCKQEKPISEFGKNKIYLTKGAKDGRAIYCLSCNSKTSKRRRAYGYEPSRKRMTLIAAKPRRRLKTREERVREAIAKGHGTFTAIQAHTGLGGDVICAILANLAFDRSTIRIVRDGERKEFQLVA